DSLSNRLMILRSLPNISAFAEFDRFITANPPKDELCYLWEDFLINIGILALASFHEIPYTVP
ncbi:MAG TPA: hypothetical protein PKZ84_15695, partial [Anaerolineae bacterium]|nr:hypothetical protein [Anaerolineae bacterium]